VSGSRRSPVAGYRRGTRFRKFAVSRRSKAVGDWRRAAMRRQPPQAVTGHLQPLTPSRCNAGNGRSQGGAATARGRRRGDGISVADVQGSATPASMKSRSNGRGQANRIVAFDPERSHAKSGSSRLDREQGVAILVGRTRTTCLPSPNPFTNSISASPGSKAVECAGSCCINFF
jgi:hypothetical protein